mmetsp:Transcript_22151/g.58724  ORF Transcript_22151/g.58724 Transcript_22151/m.58724 type:complete len:220 (-) Transcript_22151:311-970(-)
MLEGFLYTKLMLSEALLASPTTIVRAVKSRQLVGEPWLRFVLLAPTFLRWAIRLATTYRAETQAQCKGEQTSADTTRAVEKTPCVKGSAATASAASTNMVRRPLVVNAHSTDEEPVVLIQLQGDDLRAQRRLFDAPVARSVNAWLQRLLSSADFHRHGVAVLTLQRFCPVHHRHHHFVVRVCLLWIGRHQHLPSITPIRMVLCGDNGACITGQVDVNEG